MSDPDLFRGTAEHYDRGRPPYAAGTAEAFASAADLSWSPRLLDVGCGPGTVARLLAHLFVEVVGVDPDADMLAAAASFGVPNARWVHARAEDLAEHDLGAFRYATFAQSFHWMERERVAELMFRMLEPGGAFVLIGAGPGKMPEPARRVAEAWLGPPRVKGPTGEPEILAAAGFEPSTSVQVAPEPPVERTPDEIVSWVLSRSFSTPHVLGDRLAAFEADLRDALGPGPFLVPVLEPELRFYRRP